MTVPLRLIPVESGWLSTATGNLCEGATGDITIPVCTWVIEHPDGTVLFDTGLHGDLVSGAERLGPLAEMFGVDMTADLGAAMTGHGIDPGRIDVIVFSHLHFDHAGGTHAIPNARIIVQQDEWRAGHDARLVESGIYSPDDYDLGHDVVEVRGEHDIFGDGSVVCIPTPGHTAGHQSLRVELASGPVILVADCCYWAAMLESSLTPPFAHDREEQLRSMQTLRDLRAAGATLFFGHDPAQWAELEGQPLT